MKSKQGGIRKELIAGLVAVILLSGSITYIGILLWSRHDFDTLVQKSDIEIAQSIAANLAPLYGASLSWAAVESYINTQGISLLTAGIPAPGDGDDRHGHDDGFPLVVTDSTGKPVYAGKKTQEHVNTNQGAKIEWNGATVGYVFFKSMLLRSYNSHEEAFITSLFTSIGISVIMGLIFAIVLGSYLASRFSSSITKLDNAVQKISSGELNARVEIRRTDEIGRLADNFNHMAARMESTEISRRNLLADIAHELRTPVSIIQGNLEMIMEGVYKADQKLLASLYEETHILSDLIGNLRDISDLETGMIPIHPEPVNVKNLLEETCARYRPLFDEKKIELALTDTVENIRVISEETRLAQVLRNILGNALKYSPENSTVTVSCVQEKKMLTVTIADEGPGVPENGLEKIFDRFYRVDPSRNRESGGRGLGLAICKQFIEATGGSIKARNREPHGLEVSFDLPVEST